MVKSVLNCFFVICLTLSFSKAQSSEEVSKILLTTKTISELKNLQNQQNGKLQIEVRLERQSYLDFGVNYYVYEIQTSPSDISSYFLHTLVILEKNDSILFGAATPNYGGNWEIKYDTLAVNQYINKHNKLYLSDISIKEFIYQFTQLYVLEFGCGESGMYFSPEAKKMKQWIRTSNKEQLNQWLRSANIELQAYGVIGLLKIQENGKSLISEEKRIIEHLLYRNSNTEICSGCSYGLSEPLQAVIKEYEDN